WRSAWLSGWRSEQVLLGGLDFPAPWRAPHEGISRLERRLERPARRQRVLVGDHRASHLLSGGLHPASVPVRVGPVIGARRLAREPQFMHWLRADLPLFLPTWGQGQRVVLGRQMSPVLRVGRPPDLPPLGPR